MTPVRYTATPQLKNPILVVALEGWSDAADASSSALAHLRKVTGAQPLASIDCEDFYDFTVRRPQTKLDADRRRSIEWPDPQFHYAQTETGGRDLILLSGWEPSVKWRTFCDAVLEVVVKTNADLVITLGAFLSNVPHTRPTPVMALSTSRTLSASLGLAQSSYEGPTGILGVLTSVMRTRDIATLSLWAQIPFYLQANPSPKAALALVSKLTELTRIPFDVADLETQTKAYDEEVADAVEHDMDIAERVAELEHEAQERGLEIPSADELAAAFETYLKDLREDK